MLAALALLLALPLADEPADTFKPDPSWKPMAKDLWFDPANRRLVIRAQVAITEGPLEHLLCSRGSKDHESTLTTEAPPRLIHAGLLATGSDPGHPVRFDPKYAPPEGPAIAIDLEWTDAGGTVKRSDARGWIRDLKTNAALTTDWVFAGSELFEDPKTKEKVYAADDGDLITVANFPSSILDLPFRSSANDADRGFVANGAEMPKRGTGVTMYLKARPKAKP